MFRIWSLIHVEDLRVADVPARGCNGHYRSVVGSRQRIVARAQPPRRETRQGAVGTAAGAAAAGGMHDGQSQSCCRWSSAHRRTRSVAPSCCRERHQTNGPQRGEENRHFGSLRPASLRRHMRSAAPFSPQFCTCAPTAERRCLLGSVHAGEQPHRSRSATVSRSERSAQATRPPLAALATDLIASSISRPSASKLSMMDIVDREADAERPRGG